jgi:putative ABC transport system permease protein
LDDAKHQLHQSAEHRERRMKIDERIEALWSDVRYAARGLARRPVFTAVAVVTLAIGIGATTAIFSALNVLLIRPLPYARPNELMKVSLSTPPRQDTPARPDMVWSYPKFTVFRESQHVFSDLALYGSNEATLTGGEPRRLTVEYVGATYLRVLGLTPFRGRDFDPSIDAHPGAPRQAIISFALWQNRFDADPSVIGRIVDIDRQPWTVIGVAPRDFRGLTGQAELFLPLTSLPASDLGQPFSHSYWLVARRAAGMTAAQAEAAAVTLGAAVNRAFPPPFDKKPWGATASPLDNARLAPQIERSLLILFGAVGFVLLIACVNVASLLLGRASARQREIGVRLALGAGRARLVRLLLAESVLLALLGGAASVLVAWASVRALGTIDPATTLRLQRDSSLGAMAFSSIALDWRALGFTLAVAITVGVLFGLVPAIGATRESLTDSLKEGRQTLGRASFARRGLVMAEVALALVLLAGSGLMMRSLSKLLAVDPGFDARNVLTFRLSVPDGGIARDSLPGFYTQLLDRMRAIPGVADAALDNCAPLSGGCNTTGIGFLERGPTDLGNAPDIGVDWVTPTWFSTMRVKLERGRGFTDADRVGAPKVLIVNEESARRFWPNENPIGKHVEIGQGNYDDAEVIGIVHDVRQRPDSDAKPMAYVSYAQSPRSGMIVFLRVNRDAASLAAEVRRAVHDVSPQLPVYDMMTMDERTAGAMAQTRFSAVLLALFAATALSLAAVGIYGVMSLAVAARTRELGIRIALGAGERGVMRLVVSEGMMLVAAGAAIGVGGALIGTRLLCPMLFDLSPADPATYASIIALVAATAIAASWLPARRAARIDPVEALRAE